MQFAYHRAGGGVPTVLIEIDSINNDNWVAIDSLTDQTQVDKFSDYKIKTVALNEFSGIQSIRFSTSGEIGKSTTIDDVEFFTASNLDASIGLGDMEIPFTGLKFLGGYSKRWFFQRLIHLL